MKGMKGSGACSGVVTGCGVEWVVVWGVFLGVKLGEKCIFLRKSVFSGLTSGWNWVYSGRAVSKAIAPII